MDGALFFSIWQGLRNEAEDIGWRSAYDFGSMHVYHKNLFTGQIEELYSVKGRTSPEEPPEDYAQADVPPPDWATGTWKAPVRRGQVGYLEIHVDSTAGLYLGCDDSDEIYEIYHGHILPVSEDVMDIELHLDWYIYEGEGDIDVPDTYEGRYLFSLGNDQQSLRVGVIYGDALFGIEELELRWVPKTLQGGFMADLDAVG